ncbi:HNH endonuclease [Mycolicibacterium mageritense]|nr:HNH endonuclease [Mycolicibacterium mageritense]MCC9186014.1 HNH endonuclease [Mycolicibacterium mageritense]
MSDYERRDVPGYPGWQADSDGEVWFDGQHMPMKPDLHPSQYVSFTPSNSAIFTLPTRRRVNRSKLVCLAFHGECPPDKTLVAHWNDVKHDDRPENLRWATRSENAQDRMRNARARAQAARQLFEIGIPLDAIPGIMWKHFGGLCSIADFEREIGYDEVRRFLDRKKRAHDRESALPI